jgi:hypothetical protein
VPGPDDVLVRVAAAALNPYDWHMVRGDPLVARLTGGMGLRRPAALVAGVDAAGEVTAVGANVTDLRPGDVVLGFCAGALAEYARASADRVVPKPARLSVEQAAAVPMAAVTALQGLRDVGGVRAGHRVLINGAAGGVGTYGVQIATALGAEVTGVCSAANRELVRALGAVRAIDYAVEDFTDGRVRYDVILDNVGNTRSAGAPGPHPDRDPAAQRRRLARPRDRAALADRPRRCHRPVRPPAAAAVPVHAEPGRPARDHRLRRRRPAHPGDRPHLPAGRDRGCPAARGARAHPREGRHHHPLSAARRAGTGSDRAQRLGRRDSVRARRAAVVCDARSASRSRVSRRPRARRPDAPAPSPVPALPRRASPRPPPHAAASRTAAPKPTATYNGVASMSGDDALGTAYYALQHAPSVRVKAILKGGDPWTLELRYRGPTRTARTPSTG